MSRFYKTKTFKDDPNAPIYEIEYQNFQSEKVSLLNSKGNYSIDITLEMLYNDFIEVETESCQHDWVEYVGLREVFTFCKKCDIKLK